MINRRQMLVGSVVGAAGLMLSEGLALASQVSKGALSDPEIPALGNPKGNVTIVEFFDYQCIYCKWSYPDIMKVVERDGNVRLVMKDWPVFGPASVRAASMVLAAKESGQYKQAMRALMSTRSRLQDSSIDSALANAGLDPAALQATVQKRSDHIGRILNRNIAQARSYGLRGTPSFIVGGKVYGGFQSEGALEKAIQAARGA
ncbi:DsbA family protein [Pseudaminobacter soli (ex Li et al. 2025)]|uniref:Disulfide bond formation protein DsbA n=1 Tax=Pseudaminobacter soli (ex Li et al. 2025) TaxID=1295366 RepID=A0A2P7S602_9HYPH|nr:DsbA family protein [Mesorhizobium soli]PSJ57886.1 disulfide bond formation protein DsbA [Mesorhizobium soli]